MEDVICSSKYTSCKTYFRLTKNGKDLDKFFLRSLYTNYFSYRVFRQGQINLAAWSTSRLLHLHLHSCEHTHTLSIKRKKRKKNQEGLTLRNIQRSKFPVKSEGIKAVQCLFLLGNSALQNIRIRPAY